MRPAPTAALLTWCLSCLLWACGPAAEKFERVEMTTAALGLFGASKADVWGQVTVGTLTTLAHSATLKQWSAVSLAAEGTTTEPFLTSAATAGANLAWVITSDSVGNRKLLRVNSRGVSEDHTSDLPTGVVPESVQTSAKGDVLWVVGSTGTGQDARSHLYARVGDALVEQTALPDSLQVTVLAVASADEAWVWCYAPLGGAPKPRAYRVKAGVFTDVSWPSDTAPEVALGPAGEVWLWRRGGPEGSSGMHFDGAAFSSWRTTSWPVQQGDTSTVSYYAFAPLAVKAGQLALLTHATDYAAQKETERDSLRAVTVDVSGRATLGPTLATCLKPTECAAGSAAVLGDGTIVVPGAEGAVVYRGDVSALP